MRTDPTARFKLPLLEPGQAQKELYHNEALALIDIVVQASVVSIGLNTPPTAPSEGSCWVVGTTPTGVWAGAALQIAGWTAGGWRFVEPVEGMRVWSLADAQEARFTGANWTVGEVRCRQLLVGGVPFLGPRQPAIAAPSGGAVVDQQARAALGAIITALTAHGLVHG